MHPKTGNSARRLKTKKKHVMKDIEEWMVKDLTLDLNSGNTRMSGKMDATVTEVRMLKARLIDLGVERYKFLSHHTHQKRTFSETWKKKMVAVKNRRNYSALLNQIRRPITTSPFPSTVDKSETNMRPEQTETDLNKPYDNRGSHMNYRQNLGRPRTVQFSQASKSRNNRGRDSRTTTLSEPIRSNVLYMRGNQTPSSARPKSRETDEDSRSWISRKTKFSKYGGKVPTVTKDSRYAMLENALSVNYEKKLTNDVQEIIDKIDLLHKPPKNAKEAKPKWEQKLQTFMKETGLSW